MVLAAVGGDADGGVGVHGDRAVAAVDGVHGEPGVHGGINVHGEGAVAAGARGVDGDGLDGAGVGEGLADDHGVGVGAVVAVFAAGVVHGAVVAILASGVHGAVIAVLASKSHHATGEESLAANKDTARDKPAGTTLVVLAHVIVATALNDAAGHGAIGISGEEGGAGTAGGLAVVEGRTGAYTIGLFLGEALVGSGRFVEEGGGGAVGLALGKGVALVRAVVVGELLLGAGAGVAGAAGPFFLLGLGLVRHREGGGCCRHEGNGESCSGEMHFGGWILCCSRGSVEVSRVDAAMVMRWDDMC